ncbi:inclusion membrane protein A [Legionella steigerwaltii]|uniref:Inclusion membrane protein A n=1 Tax=Legionella steigerwaltii TaxID=460 RepID=A0A378L842_9GAMM|nr:LegC2/C7 family Dot/Icm T4SS effector [Legionella steigerwaltii]KTD77683.1 inclusion membrane protein A [Legionella steigerwaltii]STY22993.1 inclusion membrane protein A [Legionella steigerwaltii]
MSTKDQELETLIKSDTNASVSNKVILQKALSQMSFSDAAKKILLDPSSPPADLDSLQSIALTQEHLTQVKKSLGAIVDSLHDNPSLISRAAAFWGELPLWQRIIGGVAITGPTLIIGAAAHIGFLVTISGISAVAYTTSGIVLDDHHYHTKNIAQKLKEGIFGVAEILELTIGALDSIRKKLAVEIDKFKEENEKLAQNITRLNEEVETLSAQVEVYVETEKLLRKTKEKLEETAASLKQDLEKQNEQFQATQKELLKAQDEHSKSLLLLSQKTSELSEVRKSMGTELDKAKKIATSLEGTVKVLSTAAISDTSQRQAFQEKLNSFLTDKSASFDEVTERMSKAESELSLVKSELKASTERFNKLLELQEKQLLRLQGLDRRVDSSFHPELQQTKSDEQVKSEGLLSKFGFMALPQIWPITNTPQPAKQNASLSSVP